ncbi:hypothetical protein [Enterobacter soli]|uniref:hypothetical protein n=1 Tax=Enterobacter soli TaxID=885040 RepID=UPI002F3EBCC0
MELKEILNAKELYDLLDKLSLLTKDKVTEIILAVKDSVESLKGNDGIIGKSYSYHIGFVMSFFVSTICKLHSKKVINLIVGGYVPFDDRRKKYDLLTFAIMCSGNNGFSRAVFFAEKLIEHKKEWSDTVSYNFSNFEAFFEPKSNEIALEQVKTIMDDFLNSLKGITLDSFDQAAYELLESRANLVTEMIRERSNSQEII